MSLPDISFTNNLGTITFVRVMLEMADEWVYDGRALVHRKRITVDAYMSRDVAEALDGVVTTDDEPFGLPGELTLPWVSLSNIKLQSLEQQPGAWEVLVHVQATFIDDFPVNNIYTISYFGLTLHFPKLAVSVPSKATLDQYAHIPMTPIEGAATPSPSNPFYGPIRYRTGYGMMQVQLSGTLRLEGGVLPEKLIEILQQRTGVDTGLESPSPASLAELPPGYPNIFRLVDAVPEVGNDLALSCLFVTSSRAIWNLEQQTVRITVGLMAQPQQWKEGTAP